MNTLKTMACSIAASLALAVGMPAMAANTGSSGESTLKIGLLLPETITYRYENADRPYFEKHVKELCDNCEVLYANATLDPAKQRQQAESMLTQGADVLVIDAVDAGTASGIVNAAAAMGVPSIAYDRLINNDKLAYYVSFNNTMCGALQAKALIKRMKALGAPEDAGIIMLNGTHGGPVSSRLKKGAHAVLAKSSLKILAERDIEGWEPPKAQNWTSGQVTRFGDKIKGVLVANDGMAGGVIAALRAGGVHPLPPVTGMDASLAGIQRVLAGTQFMTIYKAFRPEAYAAAKAAVELARGKKPETTDSTTLKSGAKVPSTLLTPVVVTADKVKDTVIKDGLYTAKEICTKAYADACKKHGLM